MDKELKVNVFEFITILKKEKWLIIALTILFIGIGVVYAFIIQEEYYSQGKILPELQSKSAGNLSQFAGIASLAGIDLNSIGGGAVDAVRPDLYPDVISSTPFFLELMKVNVKTRSNDSLTFEKYYHQTIEDGKVPREKFLQKFPVKDPGIIIVNRLNEIRIKDLRKRINSSIDKKSGVITINVKMPDPVVAAEITKFAMIYLINYVKEYRTEKLRQDVDYLQDQVSSSRGKYYSTQEKKAKYTDQFQDMRLQSADVQRERIESEYRLSSSFYNELLKKYEEAKFKLHQETPIFKVLEPPVVANKKTEPKRLIIVILSSFLGICLGILVSIIRKDNFKRIFQY